MNGAGLSRLSLRTGTTAALAALSLGVAQFSVLALQAPVSTRFTAKVVSNHDGDTFSVLNQQGHRIQIRLYGVDAPERAQDSGPAATDFISDLIVGRTVEVYASRFERNNRLVARVTVGGEDVSLAILRAGLAWHSTEFSRDPVLADAEGIARRRKIGLWQKESPTPPWVFRRLARKPAPVNALLAQKGPFHGNVRNFVYHAPGCLNYACQHCTRQFETKAKAMRLAFVPIRVACTNQRGTKGHDGAFH